MISRQTLLVPKKSQSPFLPKAWTLRREMTDDTIAVIIIEIQRKTLNLKYDANNYEKTLKRRAKNQN